MLSDLAAAQQHREALRRAGQTLVFTNGHFDLLHTGHLDYLEKARALGDALFVGINGDASTRRLKGEGRPLVPAAERARLLAAKDSELIVSTIRQLRHQHIFKQNTDNSSSPIET